MVWLACHFCLCAVLRKCLVPDRKGIFRYPLDVAAAFVDVAMAGFILLIRRDGEDFSACELVAETAVTAFRFWRYGLLAQGSYSSRSWGRER